MCYFYFSDTRSDVKRLHLVLRKEGEKEKRKIPTVEFQQGQGELSSGATTGKEGFFFFDPGRGSGSGMQQWLRKQTS